MWTVNIQMCKLDLVMGEELEIQLQISIGHWESKIVPEKQLLLLIDYAKVFYCVDHNKLENSWRDGNTRPPHLPPGNSVCRSKNKLELDMEQQTSFNLE